MHRPPTLFTLIDGELLPGTASFGGVTAFGIEALARALAAGPVWTSMPDAVMIVREDPRPVLAVLGHFDETAEARLEALRGQIGHTLHRLRYVSYAQAERDCEVLAARLVERFGREDVRRFRFTAVPRGGLLVLGMLSYALDLEHAQLEPPHPPEFPLVVVDDCALTGSRFGRFVKQYEHRPVIFAPLYAHPDLRAAIEAAEPDVAACVSGRDLHDHAPERLGEAYPAWRERWARRADGPRYWIGQPDHVCFPWNEPDIGVWNETAGQVEHGWRVVPPEHCLKNRSLPDGEPAVSVQVQPQGRGRLRPSRHVLFGTFDGQLVVADVEAKTSFRLDGAAAAMWHALTEHATLEEARAALQEVYDVDEAMLNVDLQAFVEDLLARNLFVEARHAETPAS